MGNHFEGLLSITRAMDSFQLKNDAAVAILKGAAMILSKMQPQQVTDGLRELCGCQTMPLQELLESQQQSTNEDGTVKVGSKSDPVVWLDRLASVFRHVTPSVTEAQPHPCQPVVMEVWPVLSQACQKFQGDSRLIERCCRCIRFAIRCVGKSSAPLLHPLVSQMVNIYQIHQHSCFLYLGSILVDEYGSEVGCVDGLIQMLEAFLGPTFKVLQGSVNVDGTALTPGSFYLGLREHPDTVDDLFRLCTRFLQRCPVPFLQNTFLETLLGVALHAAQLDHRDANASVMKFLTELIRCGSAEPDKIGENEAEASKAMINGLLIERGEATNILRALLQSSIFYLPSYMCVDVSEVIYELLILARSAVCVALETVLQGLPTCSSTGVSPTCPPVEATATPVVTQDQLSEFHKQIVEADSAKSVQCALREFTRLFR
jgi:transportin-3